MATAEQLKSLIRSHLSGDAERFFMTALQVAAHEAIQGHGSLANDIREIVDRARREPRPVVAKARLDLKGLVLSEEPTTPLSSLVMPQTLLIRIQRVIEEYRQQNKLKSHGLGHRRKILLIGPPGTGKSMTARVLAKELRLELHSIQVDKMVTKFMGETAAKLRQVFDLINEVPGVYLFDEFDAIGSDRSLDNDVGEMRRVLNAFLQFMEQDKSESLIIAASNNPALLDDALFRRFDDVLYYELPKSADRKRIIKNVSGTFLPVVNQWQTMISASNGLSHAEIDLATKDAIKQAILSDLKRIPVSLLAKMLKERKATRRGKTKE